MFQCVLRAFSPSAMVNSNAIEQCQRRFIRLRRTLPFLLFIFSAIWELTEHADIHGKFTLDTYLVIEIGIFGVIGPALVYLFLTYLIRLFSKLAKASKDLEELTVFLEKRVEERTQELEQRNRDLAAANEQLKTLDQLKSDFVAMVSHELKGPLTTLNGGLELALQEATAMPKDAQRLIQVLAAETNRLTQFVHTILDLSRIEAGFILTNPGPVALAPMLKHLIEVNFSANNRPFRMMVPHDLPPVWADEIFLERVLGNLLSNADKYSPPGAPVEIKAIQEENLVKITVTDHGAGIPKEMQGKVFDRFQRLESGKYMNASGWGLGLYLAKTLTEYQNGKLNIYSPVYDDPEAPGTAFELILPVTEEVPEYA